MIILDDERIESMAKMIGLTEREMRHFMKRMIEAGLLRDLGGGLFEVVKFDHEKSSRDAGPQRVVH